MELNQFEKYINEAIMAVPKELRLKMENVAFVVEEAVRSATLKERGIKWQGILLGLYQGVPLTRRGVYYSGVLPDKITLFKNSIEQIAGPEETNIRRLIRDVVHHEIGHYFGMDEKRVRQWEQQRKQKNQ